MMKILFVCHGNICRSPMCEFVMKDMVEKEGKTDEIWIASAATSSEEIGHDIHLGTQRKLREKNIPFTSRQARKLCLKDYEEYDYLIGMDVANIRDMKNLYHNDSKHKIFSLLEFCHRYDAIADPWYTGDFDKTYDDVEEGCRALFQYIQQDNR